MNKAKLIALLAILLPLSSCGNPQTEEYQPVGNLEKVFQKLQDNNFTVDMNKSLMIFNKVNKNEKAKYTNYSIEYTGDYGFRAYAQKDDHIFRYSLLDGEVVSGSPLINSNTGLRYDSLYQYKKSFKDFDISALADAPGSDGFYQYEWGKNKNNDGIFMETFLALSSVSIPPESTKIKVIGNSLEIHSILVDYSGVGDTNNADTVSTYVFDIGTTENTAILNYLNGGGTSKAPIDNHFYRTINPYLANENYTVELDATSVIGSDGSPTNFKAIRYITDNAVLYEIEGQKSGYFMYQGAANQFIVDNEGELVVYDTPMADTEGNFYTSLLGGIEPYFFSLLDFSMFLGYKSDANENTYILSDSYLTSVLAGLCLIELYDEMYADYCIFEIVDEDKHEFNLYFDLYNKKTNQDLGRFTAKFSNHGNTKITAVDNYLFKGKDPREQTKDDLIDVLEMFKNNNYSADFMTSVGLTKYYYTENYMLAVPYSPYYKSNNYGFMKVKGGIYQFTYNFTTETISVDYDVDYSKGNNPLKLPGAGSYYFANDDLGYISMLTDEIYDYDNYEISYDNGQYYWKNTSISFSTTCFEYLKTYSNILPKGSGFIVNLDENSELNRVTLVSNFISNDGVYTGKYEYTFYDIGLTGFEPAEDFLKLN